MTDPSDPAVPAPTVAASVSAKCPMCGRPAEVSHRPFCSVRCADADLGRWLTGQYRVPGAALDPDDPASHPDSASRTGVRHLDPEDGLG
jgi:endogenous inhibitor of DNA gyrase (YacG/DUF329 family)